MSEINKRRDVVENNVSYLSSKLIGRALGIKPYEMESLDAGEARDMVIAQAENFVTTFKNLNEIFEVKKGSREDLDMAICPDNILEISADIMGQITDLESELGIQHGSSSSAEDRLETVIIHLKENQNPNIIVRATLEGLGLSFNQLNPKEKRGIENEMRRYGIPDFDPTDI